MKVEREVLEPIAGFATEIGYFLSSLEETRGVMFEAISDLTNEELARNILPELNSIGQLVLHIGESEYWWIQEIVGGKPMSEDEKKFAHYNENGFEDFTEKNFSAEYCTEKLNQIHVLTRSLLAKFSDADLENMYVLKRPDKEIHLSLRRILFHLLDHEATHKGQISMLKRILRESKN